jgi:hypothetical protein
LRAGDNAAGKACSRKALTGITRATRELDFFDWAEMSALSKSRHIGIAALGKIREAHARFTNFGANICPEHNC